MKWRWIPWLLFIFVIGSLAISLGSEGDFEAWLWLFPFGAYSAVGALVASRQPGNRLGWIYLLSNVFLVLVSIGETVLSGVAEGMLRAFLTYLTSIAWVGGLGTMITLAWLFFPDGRLPSRRWRPVLWLTLLSLPLIALDDALRASPLIATSPHAGLIRLLADVGTVAIVIATAASAASLIVRYRRSTAETRQQIKWIVASVMVVSPLALAVIYLEESAADASTLAFALQILLPLLIGVVPISAGLAIFKYRLYDIDFVIRKTLSYSLLTAFLALVYFGSVVLLQGFFRTLTGQNSQAVIVLSTLAVAALFTPLRRRVQGWIDLRFYRRKYDAQKMLERFSWVVRNEVELDALTRELLRVTQETMHPSTVAIWLKVPGEHARRDIP